MKRSEAIEKAVDLQSGVVSTRRAGFTDVPAVRDTDAGTIHLLGLTYLDGRNWKDGIVLLEFAGASAPVDLGSE